MQTISATGTTGPDGTLTLSIPLGRPNAEFDAVVVLRPRGVESSTAPHAADPWAAINAFRRHLAASGRVFTDSAEMIREDRER
jgi:hypothetical protein